MGEAKRRRDAGIRAITAKDLVTRLNEDAGAAVWTEGLADDPPWVVVIDKERTCARLLELRSEGAEDWLGQPHRVVLTVLRRDGRSWVSARVLDFSPVYARGLIEGLGEHAAEMHASIGGDRNRIVITHLTMLDQHVTGGIGENVTLITVPGEMTREDERRLFDLHESSALDEAAAEELLRSGWPEEAVRRTQALGGRYHRGRGSVTLPERPGVEVRFVNGKVVMDFWTPGGKAP